MNSRNSLRSGQPISPSVKAYIESYTPRWSADDLALWDESLGEAVRGWVSFAGPPSDRVARQLFRYAGGLTLYVYKTRRTLKADDVWEPRVIDHWVFQVNADQGDAWKKKARSELRRVGSQLGTRGPWPRNDVEVRRSTVKPPYREDEEVAFARAAMSCSALTRPRRLFLVAASFGAGLDGRSLPQVRRDDVVTLAGDRLGIWVSRPTPRLVPVRSSYADMLSEAVENSTDATLIGSTDRNAVSANAKRISVGGLGTLDVRRARSTWIVRHLQKGTPFLTLLHLAGVETANQIVQLARLIGVPNPDEAWKQGLLD